jgi:hypothetical protein
MADPFARLPVELLLPIAKMLPNIRSLYSLVKASPAAASVFRASGAEILNYVMTRNMPLLIYETINAIILIRSRSPLADSWDQFYQKYIVPRRMLTESYPVIPKDCSPAILWQVLELAYRIDYLAACCLNQMLAKTMELRPSVMDEQGLEMLYRWKKAPWKAIPSGKSFTPQLSTRLSWSERQRAMRALWRLQFLYDLKHADLQSWLPWLEGDIGKLRMLELDELLLLPLGGYWEEVKSVEEYVMQLDTLPAKHGAPTYRLPPPPVWATPDWLRERLAPDNEEPESYPGRLTESEGLRSVILVRGSPYTSAPFLRFDMFRHLGFAFWDDKHFTDLKLHPFKTTSEDGMISRRELGYIWRSILPDDVLTEGLRITEEEDRRKQLERLRRMDLTLA